MARLNLVEAK